MSVRLMLPKGVLMIATVDVAAPSRESHGRLFLRFLRFGLLAWGSSVAQIAMIGRELADEERWVSNEWFNRTLALYSAPVQGA